MISSGINTGLNLLPGTGCRRTLGRVGVSVQTTACCGCITGKRTRRQRLPGHTVSRDAVTQTPCGGASSSLHVFWHGTGGTTVRSTSQLEPMSCIARYTPYAWLRHPALLKSNHLLISRSKADSSSPMFRTSHTRHKQSPPPHGASTSQRPTTGVDKFIAADVRVTISWSRCTSTSSGRRDVPLTEVLHANGENRSTAKRLHVRANGYIHAHHYDCDATLH